MQDEVVELKTCFGPILVALSLKDLDEVIDFVKNVRNPRRSTLIRTTLKPFKNWLMERALSVLHGIGRCNGKHEFLTFTHEKPILFAEQSLS
ncbi:Aldehyde dehydrogenase [Aphelenchoides besseyi]|nr:Aldehyde dehydrogenase [Aphelenchoides besseyi]KAI6208609.1 Aldehyde dehydrogenase [Aphelenchoides besseyi]